MQHPLSQITKDEFDVMSIKGHSVAVSSNMVVGYDGCRFGAVMNDRKVKKPKSYQRKDMVKFRSQGIVPWPERDTYGDIEKVVNSIPKRKIDSHFTIDRKELYDLIRHGNDEITFYSKNKQLTVNGQIVKGIPFKPKKPIYVNREFLLDMLRFIKVNADIKVNFTGQWLWVVNGKKRAVVLTINNEIDT